MNDMMLLMRHQQMMAQYHNDFMKYMSHKSVEDVNDFASYKDDVSAYRADAEAEGEDVEHEMAESPAEEAEENLAYGLWERENEIQCEDDGAHYSELDINPDDPRYWGGIHLGLPSGVWIGNAFGRGPRPDMLLSMAGGLYSEGY